MHKRLAALAIPLTYLALSVLMTWPLAAHAAATLPSLGDAQLQAWLLAWDVHALHPGAAGVWDAPIFYPYPDALAFHDSMLPLALLAAPLIALSGPLLAYNLLTLLSFTLSGWAIFLLARDTLGDAGAPVGAASWSAFVAGAAFAFCAYRMSHLTQLNLLQTYWLPLALLFLRRLLRPAERGGGRLRDALACGICAGIQASAALYYAFFAAAALGGYAAIWVAASLWRRVRQGVAFPRRQLGLGVVAAVVAAAVALPLVLPYARVYATLGIVRSPRELDNWSAPLGAYLAVPAQNRIYAGLGEAFVGAPELALFPGTLVFALALLAAWAVPQAARRRAAYALITDAIFWPTLAITAFVFSLGTGVRLVRGGPTLPLPTPYMLLWAHLPGFGALRVPSRWGWLVSMAMALAAAAGLSVSLARLRPRTRAVVGGLALAIVLGEQALTPLALPPPEALRPPPLYTWLGESAQSDLHVILELPVARVPRGADLQQIIARQWFSQFHWKSLAAAYSGLMPFGASDILARAQRLPADDALSFLQLIGVDTLVIHTDEYPPEALAQLLRDVDAAPELHLRAEVGASRIYTLRPDPNLDLPPGIVLITNDERMSGVAVLGLIRRWQGEGRTLYGPGRLRYYAPMHALRLGQVADYALISDAENPVDNGYRPESLRWKAQGLSLYRRPADILASLSLALPVPGQFHPRFPTRLILDLQGGQLRVDDRMLDLGTVAGPVVIEIDCGRLQAGSMQIAGIRLAVPAGLSTIRLPLSPGTPLVVEGTDTNTALLRLRVQVGSDPLATAVARPGVVASAVVSVAGDELALRAAAAGAPRLLVDVWGAAAADDRPVHLLAGEVPLAGDGSLDLRVSLIAPDAPWVSQRAAPQDGRYIVYLKDAARPDAPGLPVAKFMLRDGHVANPEAVPLPLAAMP